MSFSDPLGSFELVALSPELDDPAIDRKNSEATERYNETLDLADAPVKSGMEPIVFVCEPLVPMFMRGVLASMSAPVRNQFAFLAGCRSVREPGGVERRPKHLKTGANDTEIADDAWFNDCVRAYGDQAVDEIGAAVYRRSRMPAKKARSSPQPPGSATKT